MTLELWVHVIVALVAVTAAVVAAGCTVDAASSVSRARRQADRAEDLRAEVARQLAAARERRQEAPTRTSPAPAPPEPLAGFPKPWDRPAPGPYPVYRARPDGPGEWVPPCSR